MANNTKALNSSGEIKAPYKVRLKKSKRVSFS